MKLILEISESKGDWRPPITLDPLNATLLPSFTTGASALVRASIQLDAGDKHCEYFLQVGEQPDVRASVDTHNLVNGGSFKCWDNELQQEVNEFKLFRGPFGASMLYLVEYGNPSRFDKAAEVTVLLDKDDVRGDYYDRMVADLLDDNLPHYVLDDFKWQMARNLFSITWNDGYTSTEDPELMLTAIRDVVKHLERPLEYINQCAQTTFVRDRRRVFLSRASHLDKRMKREVGSLMRRRGADDIYHIAEEKVGEPRHVASCCTNAHSVIWTFLGKFLLRRLSLIRNRLEERQRDAGTVIAGKQAVIRNNSDQRAVKTAKNIAVDRSSEFESLRKKIELQKTIARKVRGLMSFPVFNNCRNGLTVFDVEAEEFSDNAAYRRIYDLMLDFCRSRFWWIEDGSNCFWRMPKLVLSEDGKSRLQLKYSIVYENWCYSRMILAMKALGYDFVGGNALKRNDNTLAIFRRGTVEVQIFHGITALKKKKGSKDVFVSYKTGKLTPDFAIVVKNLNGDVAWVVADAKSDARLSKHIVEKRQKYAEHILLFGKHKPFASIIFRSGEADGDFALLEFPPPPLSPNYKQLQGITIEETDDDNSNEDYHWIIGKGIVEGPNDSTPYHGHVRVNVASIAKNPDIFEQFMEGIVSTAIRTMTNA